MERISNYNGRNRCHHIAALILPLALTAGCGGPAYEYDSVVTGTVTIDGELAKSGTVTFHPLKEGKLTIGRIHPDGSYSLRTGQGDLEQVDGGTVVPGEYVVTASITGPPTEGSARGEGGPPMPGASLIAAKYALKETSDQHVTVKSGEQVIVVNLDGPEPMPPTEESAESAVGEQADESNAANPPADPAGEGAIETTPAEPAPATAPPEASPPGDASSSDSAADNPAENTP